MIKSFRFAISVLSLIFLFNACSKSKDAEPVSTGKAFTSFVFKIIQNPALPQDISCEIIGDTVYAYCFSGTDITALKPVFAYDGAAVSVGNAAQASGATIQNFTKPVVYTIQAADGSTKSYAVKFEDTHIPAVYISTNNVPVDSREVYVPGYLTIKGNLTGDSIYGGAMEIRGRGNSTWSMPKKPYKIKLEKKAGLMGMHESKQWVLLANYADKSLMRNEVGFELSRRLGLAYTPAGRFADVILNGIYIGNYELVEQIDVDEDKVDIEEQDAGTTTLPGISGGYLVEADGFALSEPVNFTTPRNMAISVHYPDDEDINPEQKNYISNYFSIFEDKLFSDNFSDPVNGYQKHFDLESYVNWYIVNEIIGNPDIFWSTYMYKNRDDDKIYTGPVWDLDIAANNDERIGDAVNRLMTDVAHEPKHWINRLMQDRAFRNAVRNRWNAVKNDLVNSIPGFTDQLAAQLALSQKKNFTRWDILNQKVYLNLQVAGSYAAEVAYLKSYLTTRMAWLDTAFNSSRFD